MNKKPLAILFDWDDTLLDTKPNISKILNETFAFMNKDYYDYISKEGRVSVYRALNDYFPEVFGDDWHKARDYFYDLYEANVTQKVTPLPFAEEILDVISKTDIYLSVVSNKNGYYLRKEVENLGWSKYFYKVIGSTDAEFDKPNPHPVYKALESSGINPSSNVWFIGDSVIDMECSKNSGCLPIYYGSKEKLTSLNLTYVKYNIESHSILIDLLRDFVLT